MTDGVEMSTISKLDQAVSFLESWICDQNSVKADFFNDDDDDNNNSNKVINNIFKDLYDRQ